MKTLIGAAALMACCILPVSAQEKIPSNGPLDAKIVTENALVQVARISIPAHARTPMHDVTPRVVVWLSDAHFVDRYADGHAVEETRKRGDAEWVSARRHSGENLSDQPMEFVAIVIRGPAAASHSQAGGEERH
jgi:hypothetical protein